jgi:polysaccharide biosynthesis protein VpsJ
VLISTRLQQIESFIDQNGYESYDPYDGLNSQFLTAFPKTFALRLVQQLIRLSPVNLRPLLGIPKLLHTKTVSDFASGYSLIDRGRSDDLIKISLLLAKLKDLAVKTPFGLGWGFRFPVSTRFVTSDRNGLNIFTTINAIHAFLDGYDKTRNADYLQIALNGFDFCQFDLGYREIGDFIVWTYWKNMEAQIYNVNGLMLGLTARLFSITQDQKFASFTHKTYPLLQSGQNPDGSWNYSADNHGKWIDGFHTGYILEGICRAILAGLIQADTLFTRAVNFYLDHFFQNGIPKYYHNHLYPIDIQNCAQAIQTLAFLNKVGSCSKQRISSVVEKGDKALWNQRGYYNYQKNQLWTIKTPMHRWGTGPMFLALIYAGRQINLEST